MSYLRDFVKELNDVSTFDRKFNDQSGQIVLDYLTKGSAEALNKGRARRDSYRAKEQSEKFTDFQKQNFKTHIRSLNFGLACVLDNSDDLESFRPDLEQILSQKSSGRTVQDMSEYDTDR